MKKMAYILLLLCVMTSACKRKSFDEYLFEEAEKFTTQQCPKELDRTTSIDSMTYDMQTRTLNYYYSLHEEMNNLDVLTPGMIEDFTETMLINLRGDISLKKHKEENVNFAYHYYLTPSNKEAFCIQFGPKDYNGKLSVHTFNYREVRNLREISRAKCPVRQDSCTVLDSMWYDSIARTYYYDYTVNGMLDCDNIYTPQIKIALKRSLIKGLKNNNDLKEEREKEKLDFGFRYFSKTTKKLLLEQIIKNSEIK